MAASIPAERLIAELRKTKGMVATAAHNLGISRNTFYRRINRSKAMLEVLQEEREKMTDDVEMKLLDATQNGDVGAIRYYLSTQARDRGYVLKNETDITSGGQRLDFTLNIGSAGPRGDDSDSPE